MSYLLILIFFFLAFAGIPLAVALGMASVITIIHSPFGITQAAQTIYGSMNSFIMVAVPLFVLVGNLMEAGGVSEKIFDFANSLVGHITGGLGHVNVLASMLFGGISGSSVADAASLGPIQISAMTKRNYPTDYSAAISVAASTLASIIPPSILLVVAGAAGQQSVGELLLAGIFPGVLIAIFLMIGNYIISKINNYGEIVDFSFKEVLKTGLVAIPAMLSPVIILGGMMLGRYTPTEAAGIAVIYTIIISVLFYKELTWRKIPYILFDSAKKTGVILFIAMTARMATWLFTIDGLPRRLADILLSITNNPHLALLIIIVFLIFLGMIMDIMASLLVVVPIFLPTAIQLGIDPIHFLVVMVAALSVGLVTPPVGVCLFAISNVSGLSIEEITIKLWPLLLFLVAAILLIAFVPAISLFIPRTFY